MYVYLPLSYPTFEVSMDDCLLAMYIFPSPPLPSRTLRKIRASSICPVSWVCLTPIYLFT